MGFAQVISATADKFYDTTTLPDGLGGYQMVTVFDIASGEVLSCAGAEPAMDSQQWAPGFEAMARLQPVAAETAEQAKPGSQLPADIAALPVEQFLAKQIY